MLGQRWCLYWKDNRKWYWTGDWIFIDSWAGENFWDQPIPDQTMEHLKPKIPNIKDFIIAINKTTRLQDICTYLKSGLKTLSAHVWPSVYQDQRSHVGWFRGVPLKEALRKKNTSSLVRYHQHLGSLSFISFKHHVLIFGDFRPQLTALFVPFWYQYLYLSNAVEIYDPFPFMCVSNTPFS